MLNVERAYVRHDMRRVQQQFQHLPRFRRLGSPIQSSLERIQRRSNVAPKNQDLLPEFTERRNHPRHVSIHVDEARAEADEIGIVTVKVVDEIRVERREVGAELGPEALERDETAELG